MTTGRSADDVLADLATLRAADPPTHGGRVLSYVYDPGRADLDEVAAQAVRLFLPVNGLDPTTFTSVAALERRLVAFARDVLHGDAGTVGSVTSGGTESCMLAVKSARDLWRAADPGRAHARPTLVLPTTAHPAFHKAAHYLDLDVVPVPVDPATGTPSAADVLAVVDERTALVVVSAPSYPFGAIDPVAEVAAGAAARGVACHVDACVGGWVLPWWGDVDQPWDLAVPGVTSISADLHKFGYAPKGASVVLYRARERHHAQYFATTAWPGYPVVNPTMLGSRGAGSMAAAWAVLQVLGTDGLAELVGATRQATDRLIEAAGAVRGLRVVGTPTGPLVALAADDSLPATEQVDPFLLIDEVRRRGFLLQAQPAMVQPDGSVLPRTAHLTVTAVTHGIVEELVEALVAAADAVRGLPAAVPDASLAGRVLTEGLPDELAGVMATLEALPGEVVHPLLIAVLAAAIDPARE
ncbi:pyridoxal phosphate-dependent decarboxylase family protein [Cellulomonas humilata]|uniref:Glutamate/tyrosine decarboxylase-like PLP-dependent enzyme n=1 Tax=Cellulomonas humilata TaxID=144055 RepID=A0ABU0EGU7_9CELL|nr:aminotransferase class V-fold PLP-dependent enzyme [Cellulomonas humilata]MDQ0374490.1 glutamate/tyrosine decarboxylase-like PLP-dependent enzyme [Cellulomonas humilata]